MQYGNFCYSFLYSSISFIYFCHVNTFDSPSPQLCLLANVVTEVKWGGACKYISKHLDVEVKGLDDATLSRI